MMVKVYLENKVSNPESDTIYYDFNKKLTWHDYQGKPDMNSFAGAITSSGFAFNSHMNFDRDHINLTIGVYTFFSKKDSWKKPNINTDYHLLHEQHHFDITRIGAQKLVEELQKVNFTKANYNVLLSAAFNKVYDENIALQHQYDRETKNSMDVKKQLEWNEKIAAEIKKLGMVNGEW
jgi:hypothetical protein